MLFFNGLSLVCVFVPFFFFLKIKHFLILPSSLPFSFLLFSSSLLPFSFPPSPLSFPSLGISNQYISMLTTAKEMAAKREKGGGKGKRKEEEYDERLNCRELMVLCDLIKSDMEHVTGFGEVFVGLYIYIYL